MLQNDLYQQLLTEHFDVMDSTTRKTMLYINEADKSQVLGALANKLYQKIVKDVAEIDYGTIPLTKGDITKMENYTDIIETLQTIRELQVYYKQSVDSTNTVLDAIDNVKALKPIWEKGYAIDNSLVVVLYNTTCMAIVATTSLLLSTSVEFIKNPDEDTFEIQLKKVSKNKSAEALMLRNLNKFNTAYKKGDIEKACKEVLSATKNIREQAALMESEMEMMNEGIGMGAVGAIASAVPELPAMIIGVASVMIILSCIIPFLREITVTLLNAKQSLSDYLSVESDLVRLNAERVQYTSAKSPQAKKKIRDKQMKIADRLKKMSDKLNIK